MRRNWAIIIVGYFMLAVIALCLTFLLPNEAQAQEPTGSTTLTWTPPTQNEDGTAYTDYGGFRIYYRIAGTTEWNNTVELPDTTNTINNYVVENLAYGTYEFVMTAYNASNIESAFSNMATKVVGTVPQPPELSFVTIETLVYNVVKRDNGFALIAVGNVPLNTPCDINQSVNGKYVVPVDSVTWLGSVRPIVVVATCSEN